jgi:hypothetical protein
LFSDSQESKNPKRVLIQTSIACGFSGCAGSRALRSCFSVLFGL